MPIVLTSDEIGLNAAALLLCSGRQVVIPTETVYGLAANALDFDAVEEIFAIKGRPATNPLIVHVHSISQAESLGDFNKRATLLADAFWPGPLTIVIEALDVIPTNVTAGGTTVGLRMPNHLLTLQLIETCGLPIAAPSANRSEGISPTTVDDVIRSLGEEAPPILDGGPCTVGIESTVVDVTGDVVRILRPGAITRAQMKEVLGEPVEQAADTGIKRSPGQMNRHYAPSRRTILAESASVPESAQGRGALICYTDGMPSDAYVNIFHLPADPVGYAAGLYATLNQADQCEVDVIVVEMPPEGDEWAAIKDRLARASTSPSDETPSAP
jgi:L-threonylcarbamoyladenylate synthase